MSFAFLAGWMALRGGLPGDGGDIDLRVDATDGPRNILRVIETLPAQTGDFLLRYPRWIPGNHGPTGPINSVLNFHVFAGDQELTWRRDPVDMNVIHVKAPDGVTSIVAKFVVGERPGDGWSTTLGRLRWNRVVFLPAGDMHGQRVHAHLKAPAGWTIQTTLHELSGGPSEEEFETVTADRLVDSPAQMGLYAKTVDLGPGHFMDLLTQEKKELDLRPEIVSALKNLVDETGAIFGARHYRQYRFLATFSNFAARAGLEHNECREVGSGEKVLAGEGGLANIGALFCHEMFHSWNGKYRRPAGLVKADFMIPQETELVWVYEGMTQYYGNVLAARAGFAKLPVADDSFAAEISGMSEREGRSWRSVADTAVAASILREGGAWSTDRRQQDYYPESVATWLEVDATLRRLTDGKRSLDDFCRLFAGGEGGKPAVVPYRYEDVVSLLNQVAAYDWDGLFQQRVYATHPAPLTEALAAAGWRIVYSEKANAIESFGAFTSHISDIGVDIGPDGAITDLALGSAADRGGLAIGMKVVGVDGRTYSEANYEAALAEAKSSSAPITLLVEQEGKISTVKVDYHGGARHAHLERIPGTHDYLTEILAPRTCATKK